MKMTKRVKQNVIFILLCLMSLYVYFGEWRYTAFAISMIIFLKTDWDGFAPKDQNFG